MPPQSFSEKTKTTRDFFLHYKESPCRRVINRIHYCQKFFLTEKWNLNVGDDKFLKVARIKCRELVKF